MDCVARGCDVIYPRARMMNGVWNHGGKCAQDRVGEKRSIETSLFFSHSNFLLVSANNQYLMQKPGIPVHRVPVIQASTRVSGREKILKENKFHQTPPIILSIIFFLFHAYTWHKKNRDGNIFSWIIIKIHESKIFNVWLNNVSKLIYSNKCIYYKIWKASQRARKGNEKQFHAK